jgi:hypothetical protein
MRTISKAAAIARAKAHKGPKTTNRSKVVIVLAPTPLRTVRAGDELSLPHLGCGVNIFRNESHKKAEKVQIDQLRSILNLLNLKEVSRETGVHPNTLSRIARGGEARYSTVMRVMVYLKSKGLLNG